ncbi:MAG TPA: hypothetical protein DCP97_00725 [Ruminococcaceae bacterium]|nr:hypothetical protein [Oscillospiraceae bacterium]
MKSFIIQNAASIAAVLIFIAVLGAMLKLKLAAQVRQIVYYLVVKAEQLYGAGTGEIKYAAVIAWIYERLPLVLRLLFTQKDIDIMLEQGVQRLKKLLLEDKKNIA